TDALNISRKFVPEEQLAGTICDDVLQIRRAIRDYDYSGDSEALGQVHQYFTALRKHLDDSRELYTKHPETIKFQEETGKIEELLGEWIQLFDKTTEYSKNLTADREE